MRDRRCLAWLLPGLLLSALVACDRREDAPPLKDGSQAPVPVPLTMLTLEGPAADADAEISAMCWCGDLLILMPQHPERFATDAAALQIFVLETAEVEAAIAVPGGGTLRPRQAVLDAPGLVASLPGWDGIEAIASRGDTVFLAVEAKVDGVMAGYLLRGRGRRAGDGWRLELDTDVIAPIPVPTHIPNMSQEALVVSGDQVAVIFEANGVNVNPGAHVTLFGFDLSYRGTAPLEHVEYRITDASRPQDDGTFWVINYFFPREGRRLKPPVLPGHPVEHLLELRFDGRRVVRSGRAPLDLRTDPTLPARNWEALVRVPGRGFLLMTDRYPTTLLAFVPDPALAGPMEAP